MKMFEDRIIIDPEIRHGKPVIKGTRVPIDLRTKERREDVGMIIANAEKIGIEKIRQETINLC